MSTSKRIITAWRLLDGGVIYLGKDRTWVETLEDAEPLEGEAADAALAWAKQPSLETSIVDPYDMPISDGAPSGRRVRETIRAVGPTVRPDLGRNA